MDRFEEDIKFLDKIQISIYIPVWIDLKLFESTASQI